MGSHRTIWCMARRGYNFLLLTVFCLLTSSLFAQVRLGNEQVVRLYDGAAYYDSAKSSQLPAALVGNRLDVNLGNTAAFNLLQLGGTALSGANVVDVTNTAWRINCVIGCGASSFSDNSAFTFGTTAITNMGAVVDDTATNLVTENSAGAPRMNTNRILYFNPRNNAGTEIATAANPFRIDPTGTTTQPVSGTVTANAGTGTFTVGGTVTANAGTGTFLSRANDGTNSETVLFDVDSGAGTQFVRGFSWRKAASAGSLEFGTSTDPLRTDPTGTTTQPVSGTVTANAGTGTFTVGDGAGSLTVDAPVGTPVAGRLSDGTAFLTTTGGRLSVDASGVAVPVTDNAGSLTVDGTVTANAGTGTFNVETELPAGGAATPVSVSQSDGARRMECTSRVNINQTAGTQLITGVASQKIYFCTVVVVSATAQNIALVEGTGTVCATGIAGLWGGTTAATGPNLAANSGFVTASSTYTNFTATAADNVCLLQSGTGQLSGWITFISQ